MLSEKDDPKGALAELSDHFVLVETFLLGEALRAQDLIVPEVKRSCIAEVNRSLLRR